jgi:hypothetical protein
MEQDFSAWWNNLLEQRVNLVVICPVGANELVNICHNREGFPIEADWAAAHPESFKLVFQDQCRIYEFDHSSAPVAQPLDHQTCPMDALDLSDPVEMEKYFAAAFVAEFAPGHDPLAGRVPGPRA